MTLESKLSESEMKFITDIIDERHLWRTSMPIRTVYLMFGECNCAKHQIYCTNRDDFRSQMSFIYNICDKFRL